MRLIVVVEGPAEEAFVKGVLVPHLAVRDVYAAPTIVGKLLMQRRGHRERGGGHFRHWRRDIERLLGEDQSASLRVTTLFDLYGLPSDFPGLATHRTELDTNRRCDALQAALGTMFNDARLIPYIQRHEFEALVLGALPALRRLLDARDDLEGLARLEADIAGVAPEDVDDGPTTHPSKRLTTRIPGYSKSLHGPLAVGGAGLSALRAKCPRLDTWVGRLEALSAGATP